MIGFKLVDDILITFRRLPKGTIDKCSHFFEKVQSGVFAFANSVSSVWVGKIIELFICLHKSIDHLHRILNMYVIVSGSMDKQIIAF